MGKFEPGEIVAIPATLQPGAFPGEYLVTINTLSGDISGFVRDQDVVEPKHTIRAVVRESRGASLLVKLSGSYFTTNGFAEFSSAWATQNIKATA